MAGYMGSSYRRFFEVYEDQVIGIQRKMVEYIKNLQSNATNQSHMSRPDLLISTRNGYPWMPPLSDDIEQSKAESAKLLRNYLGQQYSEYLFSKYIAITAAR